MGRMIELDVGDRRIIQDMTVECTLSSNLGKDEYSCAHCAFRTRDCSMMSCLPEERKDGVNVYFRRIE